MDYDDNDFQSQNLHLAGEGNNKFPPVLRPYALPRFDFDDNLHGHLRFDSLVETEVFLGIESSETNQWIEDFSRGSTGIAFSSSAAEPCSISRHNNVWSEAASSESVEMLLKSVGQDETIPGQTIRNDSDVGDELGCIIKQMEPSLKHEDSGLSKVGDDLVPALQTGEIPGEFSGLKADAGGNPLVEDVSQKYEGEPSVHGAFEDPNAAGRNNDLPVTERDESNDCEQIVNENQMDALVDRSVENSGEEDKFASGSQVDTVITHVQSTPTGSSLKDSQDTTHLKNDIIDENVDSLEREKNVDLSQEVHIDGKNLIDKSVASFSLNAERHSALDTQPKDDGHAIGNSTANVGEDFDGIVKGDSDLHMVEGCSEGLSVEVPLQTGKSEEIVLSEGKLLDISKLPSVGDTTLKEHESKIGNADTCTSSASNMDSTVQVSCDAIEKKGLVESDCQPDMNLSSGAEESLLSVEDGKGSKAEGAAEPMRTSEDYMVTEHNDVYKCDQSVSAAEKQNAKLPSVCGKTECGPDGSPLVTKGVDPSSFSTDRKANELASNLPSDVAASGKSVDCVILPSGKATSGMTTGKGTPCETREQFSCEKVDLSSSVKDTSNAEAQSGDQKLENDRVEDGNDMQAPSLASASTVRETGDAEAQVISVSGSSEAAGDVSVQQNDKIPTKEPSSNTGQDHEPKSASQMKISDPVDGDPGKITNSSFSSTHSSESQTKLPMMESGKSSADVDNPSCGSPIVIRTSEQSQTKIGKVVKRSTDQSASASGIISEEANKEQSISQDAKGNDASPGDRSFTFEVPPLANFSEKEASKNWQPFSTMQHDKISPVVEGTPSTSRSGKVAAKTAQDASQGKLQTSEKENVRGGSKGTSERKTRRASGRSTGRESAKKGIATKETTPTRQSDRNDRTTNAPLSSPGIGQLVQSNEMQPYGHVDGGNMKSFGVLSTSVSNLPDLNTSASSSAAFNQPFTDLQQVQLRAQIFVYGALIQGTAPDEACMISAFGGPDGGRTIWENAWRVCMERLHGQKSHLVTPETPLQPRIGAKASDQSIKQSAHQSKATSTPASRSTSKGTPTTIVNPMIPLSSPLWSMSTPSGDALQPTSIPRAAVLDYQQTISPLHPPPIRNFVGHNASWMSQSPFRAPWVPQTSTFDANARFPVLPITETVTLTPTGSPANIFAGTPLLDTKKSTLTAGQQSADPKPRKRKKSTATENPVQIMPQSQTEPLSATIMTSHAAAPIAIADSATIVSKSTDKFITSVSADHLNKGERDSDQSATLSEETLGKLKEAQKQAEDAASLASTAMADEALVSSGYRDSVPSNTISSSNSVKKLGKATPASILRGEDAATSSNSVILAAREAARRRVEAASAASKQAENMDAIVRAAELAAEAVSQAGKIVAMGEPFSLNELVEAGPESYWKVPQASPQPDGVTREHMDNVASVEAPGSSARNLKEVQLDKREKEGANRAMSPTLKEMARESMEDRSRLTDGNLRPAATGGKDKKRTKGPQIFRYFQN
ncbi:hypothetical protein COLO4_37160 [Corchorus olitorius]|uniref:Agenet-like domain-containing protein n=1 Tax=Corchorus olitorius TaxID=93759 RepID=A0A1R3G327_9ROSI|nr:hypothetical protein COLO4_37160 [Corchorus olitorius]